MNTEQPTYSNIEPDISGPEKFQREVIAGLSQSLKSLPTKYLYDKAGDKLFQDIMDMPEYYPTECELDIFKNRTGDLARILMQGGDEEFDLIELGAGDAMKSSYLLKYLVEKGVQFTYRPIDISNNILHVLEDSLENDIPNLEVDSLAGDYFEMLTEATSLSSRRKVVLFLGGNIGNMEQTEIESFCLELYQNLAERDMVLIGFDLRKNPHTILNAYNDPAGITAAFNLNILSRLNRELKTDFDLEQFQHFQTYDPLSGACRSFLISLKAQNVKVGDTNIAFERDEAIHVEVSQKFSMDEIADLARKSGFKVVENIQDSKGWFVDAAWVK